MKIIAFDSECSRDYGMHCEMCMFGYTVADENFKTEISKQIYINASKPTGRSKKYMRTDISKIKDAPSYKKVRPQIASVFGWDDAVYVAHSPETTFRYLCCMDRHINAKPVRCKAYDIFTIVRNYADIASYGLSDIAKTFGIPYNGKESNVDSKTCIKILEYLCKEENTDLAGLLAACGKGSEVDSEVIYHNTMIKIKRERLFAMFGREPGKGRFEGQVFSLAESFEDNRIGSAFRIAEYIIANGGRLTRKVSESNVFIWDGNINSKRLESVNLMPEGSIRVIESNELFEQPAEATEDDGPEDVPKRTVLYGQTSLDDYRYDGR